MRICYVGSDESASMYIYEISQSSSQSPVTSSSRSPYHQTPVLDRWKRVQLTQSPPLPHHLYHPPQAELSSRTTSIPKLSYSARQPSAIPHTIPSPSPSQSRLYDLETKSGNRASGGMPMYDSSWDQGGGRRGCSLSRIGVIGAKCGLGESICGAWAVSCMSYRRRRLGMNLGVGRTRLDKI